MNEESIWQTLELLPTDDRDQIRRAYSTKLKSTNPEDDAEGFKALRAAYEQALQFASQQAIQRLPIHDPEPADGDEEDSFEDEIAHEAASPSAAAPDKLTRSTSELHRHYADLNEALSRTPHNCDAAQRAVREILESSELEHVTVRLNCELTLASVLMRHLPRTEDLLLQVAIHFRWYELENRLGAPVQLSDASECARNITYLQTLRKDGHPYSNAFKALTTAPKSALLRLRIFTSDLDSRVRNLMHEFDYQRSYGANALDPEAVHWWRDYFSKPRVSKLMLWTCVVLPLFVALVQAADPEAAANALQSASVVLLILAALTLGKLYVLDWGRRFSERRLEYIPNPVLLAPLPLAIVVCVIATVYDSQLINTVAASLAVACAAFAWFTRLELHVRDATSAWAWVAYLNIPAAVWLGIIAYERSTGLALLCALVVLTYVFAHARLLDFWFGELSGVQRSKVIAALLLLCLFLVSAWLATEAPVKPMISASVCLVVLHRLGASSMSDTQYKIRYYGMYAVVVIAWIALDLSERDADLSITASVFFLFGAISGLSMALWNTIAHAPPRMSHGS